jgi:MraZ protein
MISLTHNHFRGRFEIKADTKGRISLPSAYYGSESSSKHSQIVITNSRYLGKSCLQAYFLADWHKLEQKLAKLSELNPSVEAFSRFYLSGGQSVEIDSQNRILIPQSLRRYAGIGSETVLVGMGTKFEIWASDVWNGIYEKLTESFESTMAVIADLDKKNGAE